MLAPKCKGQSLQFLCVDSFAKNIFLYFFLQLKRTQIEQIMNLSFFK